MFKDRNYVVGLLFGFMIGVILLATMALLPPFLQNYMGYPVLDVGLLLTPRGFGTMTGMMIVGRVARKVDLRYLVATGLVLMIISLWQMTKFSVDITRWEIIWTGIVQGLGLGLVFVPLSTLSFSTLAPRYRNEATALYSLVRNIGSSIGISVVTTYLSHRVQINHAVYAEHINNFNPALQDAVQKGAYDLSTTAGLVSLNNVVTNQAAIFGYLQDFRLMMYVCIFTLPLLVLLRRPGASK
jgi:DHA2 family multidrug resistance protein